MTKDKAKTHNLLENRITKALDELRSILSTRSILEVFGWCMTHHLRKEPAGAGTDALMSAQRQIAFMLSVLLSTPEPVNSQNFGAEEWRRCRQLLNQLYLAYMDLYMPDEEQVGELSGDWHKTREISMLAFLHFFNSGLLASVEQITARITTYLVPFDRDLEQVLSLSATQALDICAFISDRLQSALDSTESAVRKVSDQHKALMQHAKIEGWSEDAIKEAIDKDPTFGENAQAMHESMSQLGVISHANLQEKFPDSAKAFWDLFTSKRGAAPELRYPTEDHIYSSRPLGCLSEADAICASINDLFSAVLLVGERALSSGARRNAYFRSRDLALEAEGEALLRKFLSPKAQVWTSVHEGEEQRFEHDVIVDDNDLVIVLEAKATPPQEPFRDPDKAFIRLRSAFRADTGIQKAFEQGNRVVSRLRAGENVKLYDNKGAEVGELKADKTKFPVVICLTRDNFGGLATCLNLLLEKDKSDPFPWAVNILDLDNLAEAWGYLRLKPTDFRDYLEQRIQLYGKGFADDELDYAAYFIKHGSFEAIIKVKADMVPLDPTYSKMFDEIYYHLHHGGPPVKIVKSKPFMFDFKEMLKTGEPVPIDPDMPLANSKVGWNQPCPCGSGKKYKRCCWARSK